MTIKVKLIDVPRIEIFITALEDSQVGDTDIPGILSTSLTMAVKKSSCKDTPIMCYDKNGCAISYYHITQCKFRFFKLADGTPHQGYKIKSTYHYSYDRPVNPGETNKDIFIDNYGDPIEKLVSHSRQSTYPF